MRATALLALCVTLVSGACQSENSAPRATPPPKRVTSQKPIAVPQDLLFNAKGELVESEDSVAGLKLPRGLRLLRRADRLAVYETSLPMEKIQRYFGPRLFTGEVEQQGQRVIYRAAIPKGVKGGVVKLDVRLYPAANGQHRVEIRKLRPMPQSPLPDPKVQALLKEQQKYMQ
ncbi:MAG: hypothetical protein H6715_00120 [Myxococcales bacterium]|nr:hypothetical protein [Myxococcales bacterium]MCB9707369.1 hypothetical protein [Myxococcales bacterium]